MTQPSVFDKFNYTELYQTCLSAGITVRPNEARDEMIAYLEGWKEPPALTDADNVFHTWRHGFIGFLNEYWKNLATQIVCPARRMKDPVNPDPKPCFKCTDAQVITCLIQNSKAEPLISKHRLVRRPRNT